MDFCCLPILCGCSTKRSSEGNDPRLCPRCNNLAVQPEKKREWFELFCLPVVPYNTDHVWHCNICNWEVTRKEGGWQPMHPGQAPPPQGQFMQPGYGAPQQGYPQQQHMQAPPPQQGYQQHSGPKV